MIRYGHSGALWLGIAATAGGSCFLACKPTDFAGNAQTAGPNASGTGGFSGAVSSGTPGVGAPALGSPGANPGGTNAGSSGGVPPMGQSASAPASPSGGNILGSLLGALGAAGSVATSVVQATTPQMPSNMSPCSQSYYVPGTANPYLAGEPAGTTITYTLQQGDGPNPTDSTSLDAPIQVQTTRSDCLVPGSSVYFFVYGSITYAQSVAPVSANGNMSEILQHQLGPYLGKSNMVAPLCALVGVFLSGSDPSYNVPVNGLDFSSQAARDYTTLSPQLGQLFFIGTGQTSGGAYHQVVVPQGATQLYFAAWDTYQWNNNLGGVNAQLMVQKAN